VPSTEKQIPKKAGRVRLRLTIALPAIVTLLTFGAGVLAVNLCKLLIFDPFGKLRLPPFHINQAYIWVVVYALISGLIGFVFAYFILSRPMKKGFEAIGSILPETEKGPHGAETETILLAQALSSLYPALGRLKMSQTLLEALQGGIMWVDVEKTILYANRKGLETLSGQATYPGQGAPLTLESLLQGIEDPSPLLSIIGKGLNDHSYVSSSVISLTFRDGRPLKLGITTSPIGSRDHLEGILLSFRELSEIQRLQKDLDQLDRLSTIGRLASGLVHEIRNPLGSLMGLLEILKSEITPGNEETNTLIDQIYQAAARIQHLLTEVLDFAGPSDVSLHRISLLPLLEHAVEETYASFRTRHFDLKKDYNLDENGTKILADSEKLKQALVNILRNAMEAVNENGEVRITAKVGSSGWLIKIFNTGSWIPEESMGKIFDPFYTTKPRGTGLGLPIARELITLQGGKLTIEREAGRGITFTIRIPGER